MPLPSADFVPLFPLQEQIWDKTLDAPLSAGIITFYEDDSRTVLKPIYQQSLSPSNEYIYTQLNNPITLTAIGTMSDNSGNDIIPFLYPYEGLPTDATRGEVQLYYITVYAAAPPVGDASLQFVREAWPPGLVASSSPTDTFESSDNQIANSQFVEISFTPDLTTDDYVFTVTGTDTVTPFAPDWSLVTTGSGTVTLKQVATTATTIPSQPPYVLEVNSSGISAIKLRQRLENSPRLFAGGNISSYFVGASADGGAHVLSLAYVPSNGTAYTLASGSTTVDDAFDEFTGTVAITGTINTNPATTGYVDIELTIPALAHVQVSSFQIVEVQNLSSSTPFLQESAARQIDHTFHDAQPHLNYKPIPSILTGWDFLLNPAQFGTAGNMGLAAATEYLWDQTIGAYLTSAVAYTRNSTTAGLQFTTAGANSAWYMMQYLEGAEARQILGSRWSINFNGFKTSVGSDVVAKIYLYRGSSAASFPTLPTSIGAIGASGVFTLSAANWTEVPRSNYGTPSFEIPVIATNADYLQSNLNVGFSGWEVVDATQISDTDKIAVVVTFLAPTAATVVTVNSVSLVEGDIPTIPAFKSYRETFKDCQYYWEKSYNNPVAVGTVTEFNRHEFGYTAIFDGTSYNSYLYSLPVSFQFKRIPPDLKFYSPVSGTINVISMGLSLNGVYVARTDFSTTNWAEEAKGSDRATMRSLATSTIRHTSASACDVLTTYHLVADSRLGKF